MVAVANGQPPLRQSTLKVLATIPVVKPTISKVRSSIEKLKRYGLLSKTLVGLTIDDPLFAKFLLKTESRGLALTTAQRARYPRKATTPDEKVVQDCFE